MNVSKAKVIYILAIAVCAMPFIDTPFALLIGIILAQTVQHPFIKTSKKLTHILIAGIGCWFGFWHECHASP